MTENKNCKKDVRHRNYIVKSDINNKRYYITDMDANYEKDISEWQYNQLKDYYNLGKLHSFVCMCADLMYPDILRATITKVIFNDPATIVYWSNGSKTVVKCSKNDIFDPEKGLAMAMLKKEYGDKYYKLIKEWMPKQKNAEEVKPEKNDDKHTATDNIAENWDKIGKEYQKMFNKSYVEFTKFFNAVTGKED